MIYDSKHHMAPNALRLQTSYGSKCSTTPNSIWLQMLYDIIWLQMLYDSIWLQMLYDIIWLQMLHDSKHHMAPNAPRLQTSYGSKCSTTPNIIWLQMLYDII
ncbi:hypothetical protein BgiMline_026910 [Biomphalaria glabrata]|nr:hypothetical protein BgiMline_021349 [Biomphalaria glabrata]